VSRPCACGCGRTAQRESAFAWLCDPTISPELKREARARGGRKVVADIPDPRFATEAGRLAFREAVAGALVRGELSTAIAAVALKACEQAAVEGRPPKGEKPTRGPVVVEMPRFGRSAPEPA
jgi:hypothetical protein